MRNQKGFTLIELLIVVAIIGIIAAIAIPSLLRARVSANEAATIGDSRSVVSGATTFASANCGFYAASITFYTRENGGVISIPNYPAQAPQFLGGDVASSDTLSKNGYTRLYQPGATVTSGGGTVPTQCDTGSVVSFCYAADPVSANLTGVRTFVATSAGSIYNDPVGGGTCQCTAGPPQGPPANCIALQ